MSGVFRCRACGAFLEAGDQFCWACGFGMAGGVQPVTGARRVMVEDSIALVLRRAHLAQQRGRLEEARRLVEEALREEPKSVAALTMLAELLRATGDQVGAVEAAQRATEVAAERGAPPGALRRAREERAAIEEEVVGNLLKEFSTPAGGWSALAVGSGSEWYRSAGWYWALGMFGLVGTLLALVALVRGGAVGYVWFGVSLVAAGWCYHDAETRHQMGLLWGFLVLCLGPFGLGIYLLAGGHLESR